MHSQCSMNSMNNTLVNETPLRVHQTVGDPSEALQIVSTIKRQIEAFPSLTAYNDAITSWNLKPINCAVKPELARIKKVKEK